MHWRLILRTILFRAGVLSFFFVTCSAQDLSVGFAGGAPLTDAFENKSAGVPEILSYSQSKDYIVGLTLEYRLPWNLSIEGDALYRELHLMVRTSASPVVTWELPLMAKYRFHWSRVDPFVEAGPAFRPTTNLNANPSHYGVTAGIGVGVPWKQFEITPMLRYSRWVRDRQLTNFAESDPNQLEVLIGFSSHPRSEWHPLSSRIALGVIGGATLIHDVPASSYATVNSPALAGGSSYQQGATTFVTGSPTALIGPALEAALPKNFFLEVDAMYHAIECSRRTVLANGQIVDSFSGAEGRTFEFPVLAKYKYNPGEADSGATAGNWFRKWPDIFCRSSFSLTTSNA